MNQCAFCDGKSQFRDRQTGDYLCLEHARLEVVSARQRGVVSPLTIRPATVADYDQIKELSLYFWDETVVDCFDKQYDVLACPAFLACDGDQVAGLAPYAVEADWDAIVLVIFGVLPAYQGRGAGWALLDTLRGEAARLGLGRILVATSNDDLLALGFYQRYGFRLTAVIPDRIADEHGGAFPGFAGILVRDEVRLVYSLAR